MVSMTHSVYFATDNYSEDIRQTITTPEAITAIVNQFKGGKAAVPSAALKGLTKLAKYGKQYDHQLRQFEV